MKPLLPGSTGPDGRPVTLGVMGGGQLGRMFVQAAQSMGYFTAVLDPDPTSPAGLVAHYHIRDDYLAEPGLAQLMQRSSAITTEFENVPATALFTLGASGMAGNIVGGSILVALVYWVIYLRGRNRGIAGAEAGSE